MASASEVPVTQVSVDRLRGLPALDGLSDEQLERIATLARIEEIAEGTEWLGQGEPAHDIGIVLSGKLCLCLEYEGCREQCVMTTARGELVDCSALVGASTWLTSASAVRESSLLVLDGEQLLALCEEDHDIGYLVMRNLATTLAVRLREARLQLIDIYGDA